MTGLASTARISNDEPQQRQEFGPHPAVNAELNAARRDSRLVPAGEGDLHRRVSLFRALAVNAWEPVFQVRPL